MLNSQMPQKGNLLASDKLWLNLFKYSWFYHFKCFSQVVNELKEFSR